MHITSAYENVCWAPILQYGNILYPNICKDFYVNLHTRPGSWTMTSRITGYDFTFTAKVLGEILNCPTTALATQYTKESVADPDYPQWEEACIALKIHI